MKTTRREFMGAAGAGAVGATEAQVGSWMLALGLGMARGGAERTDERAGSAFA